MTGGGARAYPLAAWLALPLCVCVVLLAREVFARRGMTTPREEW
jgi:hypothetical protein